MIERIHQLKQLTVAVRAERPTRPYRIVKSDGPKDLVFQSVKDGRPLWDNDILVRHIKPAVHQVGPTPRQLAMPAHLARDLAKK